MDVHLIMKNNLRKFFFKFIKFEGEILFYLYKLKDHIYIFVIAKVLFYLCKF